MFSMKIKFQGNDDEKFNKNFKKGLLGKYENKKKSISTIIR